MGSETRARIGLTALLVATLFCWELLFANADYVAPSLLGMVIAAGVAMAARRFGVQSSEQRGPRTRLDVRGMLLELGPEVVRELIC